MIFSLYIDFLRHVPGAINVDKGLIVIDNTQTPFITQLTDTWHGVPAQVDAIMTIFCTSGEINVKIALNNYTIRKDTVCIVTPGSIVEVISVSPDFHCVMMVMAKDYMSLSQSETQQILQLFKHVQRIPCHQLTDKYAERYNATIMEAIQTARWEENPLRDKMMYSYSYLLYCCMMPLLENSETEFKLQKNVSHQKEIYFRFMELVQALYREHRDVEYYAHRMGLSAKYLSKIINEESGNTALKWIENYVILEAKALLKQGGMNIQQVSERLHFTNQNSFGKFFKRCVGMSPKEYRAN